MVAPSWYFLKGKPALRVEMKRVLGRGEQKWAGWGFSIDLHWAVWSGWRVGFTSSPGFLRPLAETAFGSVHAVVVGARGTNIHFLSSSSPVAPFPSPSPPREKSRLFLSLPGLYHPPSWAQDDDHGVKVSCSASNQCQNYLCSVLLTPSLQVKLTSLLLPLLFC